MGARLFTMFILSLPWGAVTAHDPIFALGPHVTYRGGVQSALEWVDEGGEQALRLGLNYGLSSALALNLVVPAGGNGEAYEMAGKYRFWRRDALRLQESASVALRLVDEGATAGRDAVLGLAYGYESRTWYRWASLRYRKNGGARADVVFFDLVAGLRTWPGGYRDPDWVWMVEWNGGHRLGGATDGFLSPGLFWTLRNFAVKAGAQFPVVGNADGPRGRVTLEWHW